MIPEVDRRSFYQVLKLKEKKHVFAWISALPWNLSCRKTQKCLFQLCEMLTGWALLCFEDFLLWGLLHCMRGEMQLTSKRVIWYEREFGVTFTTVCVCVCGSLSLSPLSLSLSLSLRLSSLSLSLSLRERERERESYVVGWVCIDEFCIVLGGQPMPCFFTTEFVKSNFLLCRRQR